MSKRKKTISPLRAAARTRLSAFGEAFARPLLKAVRPILSELGDSATLVGSSVLLRVGDRHFALTAAHVADEPGELLIAGDDATFYLPEIETTRPPGGIRDGDAFDIGFVELPRELAEALGGVKFLTPADVDVDDQMAPGPFYTFIGYPTVNQRLDTERRHFDPLATVFTNPEETSKIPAPFNAATHVAMRYDRGKAIGADGRRQALPSQKGVSGGGMWRVDALRGSALANKLVAITIYAQTTGTRLMIGTRVTLHLEAIRHRYPELGPLIPHASGLTVRVKDAETEAVTPP
jgi:hypothetical protein